MLAKEFADRNQLAIGRALSLGTVEGEKQFTVRGVMKSSGLTSAFGGNLAIMDIYAAQKMFGRGRTFDRIDLALKPAARSRTRSSSSRAARPGLPGRAAVGPRPAVRAMLAAYSMMVGISSLFALFIGMFIIYNSFAIAVTQRRSEIGILRALGATRRQIRWLFLGESAVTGLDRLARRPRVRRADRARHRGVDRHAHRRRLRRRAARRRALDQPGAAGARAGDRHRHEHRRRAIPARNAARVDPVQALQKGKYQVLSAGESRLRAILGACSAPSRSSACSARSRRSSTPATCWRSSSRC
jgi:hypothetical protein